MKINRELWLSVLVLIVVVAICGVVIARQLRNVEMLEQNQQAYFRGMEHYRFRDSLSGASVQRLTLTIEELRTHRVQDAKLIKELGLKLRRVQSLTTATTQGSYSVQGMLRDSMVVIRDTIVTTLTDTLQCLDYHDQWLDFSACIEKSDPRQINAQIVTRDTLVMVAHRLPRKFLFFNCGTRGVQLDVISKNPNSTIVHAEYLEFKKR